MHALAKLLVITSVTGLLFSCSGSKPDAVDSQNQPVKLKEYLGNTVLINYWASWCKPCIEELPALNEIYKQPNSNVTVLAVSFDRMPNNEINQFKQKLKLDFPMFSTFPLQKIGTEMPSTLPETFVLNRQGKLVDILKGPQTAAEFRAAVKKASASNHQNKIK